MSEQVPNESDENGVREDEMGDQKSPIQIESVAIERAPGFETGGFTVDEFSPGVNVIYGENAAGKSTLSQAIRWSLWPDAAPESVKIRTQFEYDGEPWVASLRGGVTERLRDGATADPVPVPSLCAGQRYSLSLHDMLQEQTDDGEFAAVIQRESTGGFNVDGVRADLGLEGGATSSNRNLAVTQEAEEALEEVRTRRRESPDLVEEQAQLSQLEDQLEEAEAARKRVDLLEKAVGYAEARTNYEEAKDELETFPDELAAFDGNERERLSDLDEQILDQKRAEQEAAAKNRDAAETLEATELPEDGVSDEDIQTLEEYEGQIDDAEDDRDRLEREFNGAKEEREEVRDEIPLDLDEETLRNLKTDDLEELRSFVAMVTEVDGKKRVESSIEEWLSRESNDGPERSTLESGRDALENWLSARPKQENAEAEESNTAVWTAVVAGVLAAVAGVYIGLAVNLLGFTLTVLGLGLAAYAFLQAGNGDETEDPRATHEQTFQDTGLEDPAKWEAEPVRERLSEVRKRLAELELNSQEAQRREKLLARYDTDELAAELEEARDQFRERLDTDVDEDFELAVTVERVERWQAADEEVKRNKSELSKARDQIECYCKEFLSTVEPYTTEKFDYEVETAAEAAGVIKSLESRKQDFEDSKQTLEEVSGAVTEARNALEELTTEREELFTERGLEPGDQDRLGELCEELSDYEDAAEAKNDAETILDNRREELREHSDYDDKIEEREEEALRAKLQAKRKTANEHDELLQEKTKLRNKIDNAKESTIVADAVQRRDQALRELQNELEKDVGEAAADVLLDFVEQETVTGNQEPVFRRADELLRLVTGGQFELRLEDGVFRAYDTGEDRRVDLNDLSSGTRVQVLLAVRVAFVEHREQETAPPLLLDETLAPFDDRRAETVLDTVIELARQGRQVFYFTARSDERARWKRRLEESAVEYSLQELTAADSHDPIADPPTLETTETVNVPEPEGDDHEAYRDELNVPTFDPRQGAASAHLWYVTEDPEVLYKLRTAGLERWGHFRSLLNVGGMDGLLSETAHERVRRHGKALETFVDAYTVGRGKPVDREVLEASEPISDRFIDEASELATSVDGKPEPILDGLSNDVSYFRDENVENLRTYLREEGFLDPRPTRPDKQIHSEVVDCYCQNGLSPETATEATARLFSRISAGPDPSAISD